MATPSTNTMKVWADICSILEKLAFIRAIPCSRSGIFQSCELFLLFSATLKLEFSNQRIRRCVKDIFLPSLHILRKKFSFHRSSIKKRSWFRKEIDSANSVPDAILQCRSQEKLGLLNICRDVKASGR